MEEDKKYWIKIFQGQVDEEVELMRDMKKCYDQVAHKCKGKMLFIQNLKAELE